MCQHLINIAIASTASQVALVVKNPLANTGDLRDEGLISSGSLGREGTLEEGMATHPSFLPGESHQQVEPSRLQPMGSQRVELSNLASTHALLLLFRLLPPIYNHKQCLHGSVINILAQVHENTYQTKFKSGTARRGAGVGNTGLWFWPRDPNSPQGLSLWHSSYQNFWNLASLI